MARRALIFALGVLFVGSAFGGDQRPLSSEIQKQLSTKYPNHKVVNWCSGKFVGKEQDAVAVLRDESKKQFLVLWVMSQGGMRGMVDVQKVARQRESGFPVASGRGAYSSAIGKPGSCNPRSL